MAAKKPETVPVDEARKRFGRLITAAAQNGTVTIISKNGIPAAAVVPLSYLRQTGDR